MKSLWNRLKYSVQADLHEILDEKENKNPITMLNQYIREAEKQTNSVGKLLERQRQLKVELEKELLEAKEMASKRQRQLELAESTEEDDLIAFAKAEVEAYHTRTLQLTESIQETTAELMSLEHKFEEMKHKVKDMKVRQLQLMGKENVVRAHHQMDRVIAPKQAEQKLSTFEEMEEYIHNLSGKIDRDYETSSMERRLETLEIAQKDTQIV